MMQSFPDASFTKWPPLDHWEAAWAPYDELTYQWVLNNLQHQDCVIDIGAGDLRLAFQIASRTNKVYAIEMQQGVIQIGLRSAARPVPKNLKLIIGDARSIVFPNDVTVGILLMRHCKHFHIYIQKLRQAGCQRLITNARWGMGVEQIDLLALRKPYAELEIGWYACWCGAVGFKAGSPETLLPDLEEYVWEVDQCPQCATWTG